MSMLARIELLNPRQLGLMRYVMLYTDIGAVKYIVGTYV